MVSHASILRRSLNSFHVAAAVCVLTFPAGNAQSQTLPAPADPQQAEAQQAKQRVSRDARQEAREKLEETIAGRNNSSADLRAPDLGVWFLQPGVSGLTVADVANQSVFAAAGLVEGDRILSINGQTVADEAQFLQMLTSPSLANQTVDITVARGNDRKTVSLSTGPLMQGVAAVDPLYDAGMLLDDRNPNQLVVQRVFPRTPAFYAGLRAGDVLTSVDGQGLGSIDNLVQALQRGNELSVLGVTRNGQPRQLTLGRVDASVRTAMRPDVGGTQTNAPANAAGNVLPPSAVQPLPGSPTLPGSTTLPGSPSTSPAAAAPRGLQSSPGVVNPAIRGGANPPAGAGTFGGTGATAGGAGAAGGTGAVRGGTGSTAGGAGATGGTGAAAGGTGSSAGAGTSGGAGAGGAAGGTGGSGT
jgi:hypothetical protein